jgi:hypothetical protein
MAQHLTDHATQILFDVDSVFGVSDLNHKARLQVNEHMCTDSKFSSADRSAALTAKGL